MSAVSSRYYILGLFFLSSIMLSQKVVDTLAEENVLVTPEHDMQDLDPFPVSDPFPDECLLSQNYPNPFNPVTNISFSIPEKQYVEFRVYDLLGSEIGTPVRGLYDAGVHTLQFNGSTLPNGLYFYSLSTGSGFVSIKKMILLK